MGSYTLQNQQNKTDKQKVINYWGIRASLYLSLLSLVFIKVLFFPYKTAKETRLSLEFRFIHLIKGEKATHRTLLLPTLIFMHALNSPHLSAIKDLPTPLQNWGQNNYSLHKTVTGKYFITTINPLEHYEMANFSE